MSPDSFAWEFIVWVALGEFRELERKAPDPARGGGKSDGGACSRERGGWYARLMVLFSRFCVFKPLRRPVDTITLLCTTCRVVC